MRALRLLAACCVVLVALACGRDGSEGTPGPSGTQPGATAGGVTTPGAAATPLPAAGGGALKGVSLSPRSFSEEDFTAFFGEAAQVGRVVGWYGDWAQLGAESAAPAVVAELAGTYGYEALFIASPFNQTTGLLRPLDAAQVQAYRDAAAAFAGKYRPAYLGLGIEVNSLWERLPDQFEAFVVLFDETYDAVKAASPETQVFTVFQLERMKGLHGGLFGGTNDPAESQWHLLERFAKADLFAFTTYPGIVYPDPADIPDGYYAELTQRTGKPVALTEIGWPSVLKAAGWESSEDEQGRFVERFLALVQAAGPRLLIWSFLYDQGLPDPFQGSGLLRDDGSRRPAWYAWTGE